MSAIKWFATLFLLSASLAHAYPPGTVFVDLAINNHGFEELGFDSPNEFEYMNHTATVQPMTAYQEVGVIPMTIERLSGNTMRLHFQETFLLKVVDLFSREPRYTRPLKYIDLELSSAQVDSLVSFSQANARNAVSFEDLKPLSEDYFRTFAINGGLDYFVQQAFESLPHLYQFSGIRLGVSLADLAKLGPSSPFRYRFIFREYLDKVGVELGPQVESNDGHAEFSYDLKDPRVQRLLTSTTLVRDHHEMAFPKVKSLPAPQPTATILKFPTACQKELE